MLNNLNHECTEQSEQHFKEQLFCSLFELSENIYQANLSASNVKNLRLWQFNFIDVGREKFLGLTLHFSGEFYEKVLLFSKDDLSDSIHLLSHFEVNPLLIDNVSKFCQQTIFNSTFSHLIEKEVNSSPFSFEVHFGTITSPRSPFTLYDKNMFKEQFKRLFGKDFFIVYEKNQLEQSLLKNNTREKKLPLKI